jgi:hypothetical protein
VEVWYEKNSAAQELWWAADFGRQLSFNELYQWNTSLFRARASLPRIDRAHPSLVNVSYDRHGTYEGANIRIMRDSGRGDFVLRMDRSDGVWWMDHADEKVLERYFTVVYGPIQWR